METGLSIYYILAIEKSLLPSRAKCLIVGGYKMNHEITSLSSLWCRKRHQTDKDISLDSQISLLPLGFSLHFLGIACLSTPGCYQRLDLFISAWRLYDIQDEDLETHPRLAQQSHSRDKRVLMVVFFTAYNLETE